MASLNWTVGSGSDAVMFSLTSPRPTPANRFFSFIPDYLPAGPRRTTLDRKQHVYAIRHDYSGKFIVRHLPPSEFEKMLALKKHLIEGGDVDVTTNDIDDNSYTLTLKPGTTPVIEEDSENDGEILLYSFTCELAGDTPIVVNYDG